ncbi:MAG TPA: PQQ-dependent sugar dehydrogenase [Gemmatimonadales bacterium]|nr:PQQ-dependent sugar dehydrogenase [Gemmatimonadales bacterium]
MTNYQTLTGSFAVVVLLGCSNAPATAPPPTSDSLRLVPIVASGLSSPVYLTAPPGDTARLFVVEQAGQIRVVQHGQLLAMPFLDITGRVLSGGEEGLLSVAFHPLYATNHYFYVDYTRRNAAGDTVYTMIERYSVSADSNVADSSTHKLILQITQPQPVSVYPNHKGGLVMFGPDGLLSIGMGDGGSGGDPQNRAQNPDSLLGKLLRIDVDGGDPYINPPNNPYAGGSGRGEIWAIGLRNPWRYAFDRPTGLLYIADVGQNDWEEVDVAPASQAGVNYGWPIMEGAHCYRPNPCSSTGLVLPVIEYDHSEGCSIIGGFVYRGSRWPSLAGQYFYSDYCSGWLRSFAYANGAVTGRTSWTLDVSLGNVTSFGEDAAGELYVLSAGGSIYRIVPAP